MLAAATAEQYALAIQAVAADPNIDAIIAIFLAPLATRSEDVARALVQGTGAGDSSKPILAVFMSPQPLPDLDTPAAVTSPVTIRRAGRHRPGACRRLRGVAVAAAGRTTRSR